MAKKKGTGKEPVYRGRVSDFEESERALAEYDSPREIVRRMLETCDARKEEVEETLGVSLNDLDYYNTHWVMDIRDLIPQNPAGGMTPKFLQWIKGEAHATPVSSIDEEDDDVPSGEGHTSAQKYDALIDATMSIYQTRILRTINNVVPAVCSYAVRETGEQKVARIKWEKEEQRKQGVAGTVNVKGSLIEKEFLYIDKRLAVEELRTLARVNTSQKIQDALVRPLDEVQISDLNTYLTKESMRAEGLNSGRKKAKKDTDATRPKQG